MIKRIKRKFKHLSKSKRIFIIIIICLIVFSTLGLTLGRYIYDNYKNLYFASKNFYFNSDKLSERGAIYQLNNWSGVDQYSIVVNMNSRKNNLKKTTSDIAYDISYQCSSTVICNSNKDDGIIYSATNSDSFIITVTPNTNFADGDSIIVYVTASSTDPYVKSLNGRFILKVGKLGLSYEINDSEGSPYLELRVTNTLEYYEVRSAFTVGTDTYSVGDRIDISTYLSLSDANKEKCASVIISLTFDPNTIVIDNTSQEYLANIANTNTTINNYDYINGFSFKIDAINSVVIKFYKTNTNMNYTYPIINDDSIIGLTYS